MRTCRHDQPCMRSVYAHRAKNGYQAECIITYRLRMRVVTLAVPDTSWRVV
jgi:hypothetical protein